MGATYHGERSILAGTRRKTSSRNSQKEERERLLGVVGDAGRPMDERGRALEELVDRGAVDEVSEVPMESKWPDDMREEAVYGPSNSTPPRNCPGSSPATGVPGGSGESRGN